MEHNSLLMRIPAYKAMAEQYASVEEFKEGSLNDFMAKIKEYKENISDLGNSPVLRATFSSLYQKTGSIRTRIYKRILDAREFYLTEVILTQMYEDALAPDISTGDILSVTSPNKEVQKELDYLEEKFKFDKLVSEITIDLLAFGEYKLRNEVIPGKGLVEIHDDVDQIGVIGLYKNGETQGYLALSEDRTKVEVKQFADYTSFILKGNKLRVKLFEDNRFLRNRLKKEQINDIPTHVRMGRSLIYPVLSKLKELELLEQLIPVTKLAKLSTGQLLGTQVPVSMTPDEGFAVAKRVEQLINKRVAISEGKELTIENIMASAGKLKVVPMFGDKGTIHKFDYKMDEPDDLLDHTTEIRKIICESIGIPYEILFTGDSTDSKSELLKRHARYLRKLKNIQSSIREGVIDMVSIHLINKNINFEDADIEVSFRNKLVEADELQRIEYIDMMQSFLGNIRDFVNEIDGMEQVDNAIDWNKFFAFINKQLTTVGLEDVINEKTLKVIKPEEKEKEKEEEDDTGSEGEEETPEEKPDEEPEEEK